LHDNEENVFRVGEPVLGGAPVASIERGEELFLRKEGKGKLALEAMIHKSQDRLDWERGGDWNDRYSAWEQSY
jgi:hypothetical protein